MNMEELEQAIRETLTPDISNIFYDAITTAVDKGKVFEANELGVTPRTVSNYIHDNMCSEIERKLSSLGENRNRVVLIKKYGTLKLSIDNGRLIVRLKKMTRQGVTSNIVTQPVLEFEQMSLFPDDSIKLNAGYCYTHGGVDYDIIISHPNGLHRIDWCQSIDYINDNVEQFVTKMPAQTATGQRKRKLLPRKDAVKHAKVDKP